LELATGIGRGAFNHPDGYILTNFHVVQQFDGFVVLPNGDVTDYQYIGGVASIVRRADWINDST